MSPKGVPGDGSRAKFCGDFAGKDFEDLSLDLILDSECLMRYSSVL